MFLWIRIKILIQIQILNFSSVPPMWAEGGVAEAYLSHIFAFNEPNCFGVYDDGDAESFVEKMRKTMRLNVMMTAPGVDTGGGEWNKMEETEFSTLQSQSELPGVLGVP